MTIYTTWHPDPDFESGKPTGGYLVAMTRTPNGPVYASIPWKAGASITVLHIRAMRRLAKLNFPGVKGWRYVGEPHPFLMQFTGGNDAPSQR